MEENKKYLIALSSFLKFGPRKLKKLKNFFHNWKNAFNAGLNELEKAGLSEKEAEEFVQKRIDMNPDALLEELEKEKISVIDIEDKNYPPLLLKIYDPPMILYYKGELNFENDITLAVVGSRKCTHYGEATVNRLIPPLVRNNITIVSGLAFGIDSLAQNKTADEGGKTIAVLGSGLSEENIYPRKNRPLIDKIIANGGAIISEFHPSMAPLSGNFPQRNRIISGLSLGVLVIEGCAKSGSLITANFALEQGREVMAVPGSIFSPFSQGPNNLIKIGAKPITSAEDALEALGLEISPEENSDKEKTGQEKNLSPEEAKILKFLSKEPVEINELAGLAKLDIKTTNSTLSLLEIKGIAKNIGCGNYIIN